MREKLIYGITFLVVMIGCITPYEPQGITPTEGLLVVEAILLAPVGTEVKLSRTIALDKLTYEPVSATVKILSDDGVEYRMTETQSGTYTLEQEFTYRDQVKYALDIEWSGKHYRSAYVIPSLTPDMSFRWAYNEKHEQLEIMVSVDNPDVDVAYYRWSFKENWEFMASHFATHRWDPVTRFLSVNDPFSSDNSYYCWSRDSSTHFILGSSEKKTTTSLRDKVVQTIPLGSPKFRYLYHIDVKQHAIPKEAYNYFRNLQDNVETTGSLFGAQPTEMKGNITCVDNLKEAVIGYFVATTEASRATYIEATEVPEMKERSFDCLDDPVKFSDHLTAYDAGYFISLFDPNPEIETEYMPMRCVDCTRKGGTKNRPAWWKTDHY